METFEQARRAHGAVRRAAESAPDTARALWRAVTTGEAAPGTIAAAVVETAPVEYAGTIAALPTAAAAAFGAAWTAFAKRGQQLSPFEAREVAREGWGAFAKRAGAAEDVKRGLGADASDAWQVAATTDVINDDEQLALVREVARLAGRMYAALRGTRAAKVHGAPEEVYNVELGAAVGRLLPSELAQLADEDIEILPMGRIVERRALQYAVRGHAPAGGGPLVVAIDESDSMAAADGYNVPLSQQRRRVWAAAAAVALTRVAFDAKRPVAVVHWSSSHWTQVLKPGNTAALVELATTHLGGGTLMGAALNEAGLQVERFAREGARGADVVLVTDGNAYDVEALPAALEALRQLGTRLWVVGIDTEVTGPVRKAAVKYVHLSDKDMDSTDGAQAIGGAAG